MPTLINGLTFHSSHGITHKPCITWFVLVNWRIWLGNKEPTYDNAVRVCMCNYARI